MINKNKIIYSVLALAMLCSVYMVNMVYSQKNEPYTMTKTVAYQHNIEETQSNIIAATPSSNIINNTKQDTTKLLAANLANTSSNQPTTRSKDFDNTKPVSPPKNSSRNIFSMKLYDIKTPSPIPHIDPPPIGWATGLATDMNSIIDPAGTGAKLSGIPGTPFVNDVGGSTLMAELKFDSKDIAKIEQNINKFKIKVSFEVMTDIRPIIDTSTNPGLTDGWAFTLMQNLNGIGIGGFGDYSDDIHVPIYLSYGYQDLGPTQTHWVKHEFLIPSNIDLNTNLQIMFLAEQSTEPLTPQWTLMIRGLRVEAIP